MTTRPIPIVHQSVAGARAFYRLRRKGYSHEEAASKVKIVNYCNYWCAA